MLTTAGAARALTWWLTRTRTDLFRPRSGRLDAALQDEVAASEGFLKQPAGKDFAFAGPSVKDKKYFGDGTGIGPA
ncbi:lysine/arginine/ornithine ABC transporter substrate-binding periplasmic protein [Klebsiella pneumoniae]|uniref:Lysine/arginine/ornithine ABC transporter substrate-binding periplasmic protein n=1 Tax=Klebsiella pneumoniae TaxID=573 RepID=A0A378BZ24_KLEPN|nr:lysine/arginine/ornithine ABC transporter substrate-binding periplasmic protein [Klebsiella pneumoniae]